MKILIPVVAILTCFISQQSLAQINVLACEAEWAALALAIGAGKVQVHSATTALQDPHHIQARPSLIAKARNADLLICSGAELETGWLPVLLRKSANPKIQPGKTGHFMATEYVNLLGKPEHVDRSDGDIHASGNPHIHTNPQHMLTVAKSLSETLGILDPEHAPYYQQHHRAFSEDLQKMLIKRQADIAHLKGQRIVVHHDSWTYLEQWLGLEQLATLEPKPGVPPTSGHLSALVSKLEVRPADMIIYASYQNDRAAKWLSGKTGTAKVALPYSVNNWQNDMALIFWYEEILDALLTVTAR
jgi:zinc/manganese transport system substrate-binding protein